MRLSIALVVVGFLCLAPPARASAPESSLRIYGAYLPSLVQWEDAAWGYGFATRVSLNARWGVDVGASRFESSNSALAPMTVGFSYGPQSRDGWKPWLEAGVGYYRRESTEYAIARRIGPLAPYYGGGSPRRTAQNNIGGYAGIGFDAPLPGRFALVTGVRMHGWSDNDGFVALQSGLSYEF